jgi:tetratricopeptide (TPR) repeat protein
MFSSGSQKTRLPDLHVRIGDVYLRKKRMDDAERAYKRALEIDGDSPAAHLGLAITHLQKRQNELAAERALHAVGLQHFLPLGHFYLGVALARLGHRQRAALAFETCLTMLPGLISAHRWLATLYQIPRWRSGKGCPAPRDVSANEAPDCKPALEYSGNWDLGTRSRSVLEPL